MSGALLLIVLVGFSPTLYLRSFFDVPPIPMYVLIHGVVHTAWFVAVLLQSSLVTAGRSDVHRKLGWAVTVVGIATFVFSLAVTILLAARQETLGIGVLRIFWANLAALLCFAVFLCTAIATRRRLDVHKRLMILAAISVVQPALARIRQWPVFESIDGGLWALVWLALLIAAVAVHDLRVSARVHSVTLLGGVFFLGARVIALYVVAPSDFGVTMVRELIE
jgi:hypothetical protein